jgi:hypothetical protein
MFQALRASQSQYPWVRGRHDLMEVPALACQGDDHRRNNNGH